MSHRINKATAKRNRHKRQSFGDVLFLSAAYLPRSAFDKLHTLPGIHHQKHSFQKSLKTDVHLYRYRKKQNYAPKIKKIFISFSHHTPVVGCLFNFSRIFTDILSIQLAKRHWPIPSDFFLPPTPSYAAPYQYPDPDNRPAAPGHYSSLHFFLQQQQYSRSGVLLRW